MCASLRRPRPLSRRSNPQRALWVSSVRAVLSHYASVSCVAGKQVRICLASLTVSCDRVFRCAGSSHSSRDKWVALILGSAAISTPASRLCFVWLVYYSCLSLLARHSPVSLALRPFGVFFVPHIVSTSYFRDPNLYVTHSQIICMFVADVCALLLRIASTLSHYGFLAVTCSHLARRRPARWLG